MNTATAYSAAPQNFSPTKGTRRIAEIIIPDFTESNAVILPMIASLSKYASDQWTTWITHRRPSKLLLEMMGADLSRLRIVHVKADTDNRWIVWQALAQGNSHNVIAEQTFWDEKDIIDMEIAGNEGNCRGILITTN